MKSQKRNNIWAVVDDSEYVFRVYAERSAARAALKEMTTAQEKVGGSRRPLSIQEIVMTDPVEDAVEPMLIETPTPNPQRTQVNP